jgi:hypothetical protein
VVSNLQFCLNNMQEEQKLIMLMCAEQKKNEKTFWKPKTLPVGANSNHVYPSQGKLVKETAFGKPNILKSYIVIPALSQVLCPILHGAYLDPKAVIQLGRAIPGQSTFMRRFKHISSGTFAACATQTSTGKYKK